MPSPAILIPADPLNPRRPDPHFAWEARLLRDLGGVRHLVDHDALLTGDAADAEEAVRRVPEGAGPLWYRGWMLPSARYAGFAAALAARGCHLLTSPAGYRTAHELPGWYGVFEGATPPSTWIPYGDGAAPGTQELAAAVARLGGSGPAIVKDYVKSRKHEWHEACYVPELADLTAVGRVVGRFVELQGEFLAGGVVLRRFEQFERAGAVAANGSNGGGSNGGGSNGGGSNGGGSNGGGSNGGGSNGGGSNGGGSNGGGSDSAGSDDGGRAVEARVWWLDGRPILVGPHPDAPHQVVEPQLAGVSSLVRTLGCRFVTTDLARLADGSGWRVVEVGDGQVSDLPRGIDASGLLTSLIAA
ncbi:ATP-grasp domain-containing protein [Streptomyces sp. NRRL WC-3742]|uniref:ATP-grasp domain-containing protein n=1 Tax=Streptomyces sp. NRRL WC-3742 TaxID=1463934 RepID=UPI00068FEB88|nr:ATP-grasp domain-containing protein [Streptomyces sp. NRRL WC-3742]